MLTQERVQEVFDYVEVRFRWKVRTSNRIKLGDLTGGIGKDGYRFTGIDEKLYPDHQLIFLYHHGYIPENDIDHIDRNPLNNRIENLREVSRSCNSRNCGLRVTNRSGVTGVSWDTKEGKWAANIVVNRRKIHLGTHSALPEAVAHRLAAEQAENWPGCNSRSPAYVFMMGLRA